MGYLLSVIYVVLIVFALIEANYFIRFDGKMKRGIKIDSEFVSNEITNSLLKLKSSIVDEDTKAFIRKENQIVLIQPISHYFQRNIGFWYIGVIDLSRKRPKISYYTPLSAILFIVILAITFISDIFVGDSGEAIGAVCTVIFLPIFFVIAHPLSKKVVMSYLEKALKIKRA